MWFGLRTPNGCRRTVWAGVTLLATRSDRRHEGHPLAAGGVSEKGLAVGARWQSVELC